MNTVRCPLQSGDEGAILLSYLDRRLDPDSTAALDRHVAVCPDCARMVDAQRAIWTALDQWEPVSVPADFDNRVMARIAADRPPLWRRLLFFPGSASQWWKPAMPLAAACVALLAVALWHGHSVGTDGAISPSMDAATEAQQVEDTLSDLEMLKQLGVVAESPSSGSSANSQSL